MILIAKAVTFSSRSFGSLRNIHDDALYRGSLYLLANNVATSAIGFVFWTLAAHRYSASAVGVFSGITSGASLLAAIAAIGLPITMTRYLANAEDPRELVMMAVVVISTAGTVLCFVTVLFLAPHLPPALHIQQHGITALLVIILVVFTAVGSTLDAGLIAIRSSRVVLIKNLAGSTVKLIAMLVLAATFRSSGLLISFGLGLVLATGLSGIALARRINRRGIAPVRFHMPWNYLSATSGNYLATVIGILPLTLVPIEVLAARGAAQTAAFSIAFLISGFLNFIPSTTGQVLFAEIARGGVPLGKQLRKALRAVYGLLLVPLIVMLAAAPLILGIFGHAYSSEATGCLRILALSALPAGGTHLISSLLIARDRLAAYTFMQIANAVLVLGFVGVLLPRGLTAAAAGLALAQVVTLILCLLALMTGRAGRHHSIVNFTPAEMANQPQPDGDATPFANTQQRPSGERHMWHAAHVSEPEIRELLAAWPLIPTTLIAEQIDWEHSVQFLAERVTELRSTYWQPERHYHRNGTQPGETAQCGFWLPPIDIPVGYGQVRSAWQLPVLTMITDYSRWLSAILIPSMRAEDVFAGWWELIIRLGAVPRNFVWHGGTAIGRQVGKQTLLTPECGSFCRFLSTEVVISRPGTSAATSLIESAHAYLEQSFLRDRVFNSPRDFNAQLNDWLAAVNKRDRRATNYSPAALIAHEREAMLQLPPIPPTTGWRQSIRVAKHPFIHFDYNRYRIPSYIGDRTVDVLADLNRVRVLYGGALVAEYSRAWARGQTIPDLSHEASRG